MTTEMDVKLEEDI